MFVNLRQGRFFYMANFELQFELGTKCFNFYQEVLRLTKNDHGYCFKKNGRFCEEYGVTERTVQRWLKKLSDLGLIKVELIKNKYRRIFATEKSRECRPNVGVNNKLLTNKLNKEIEPHSQKIKNLKEEHGTDLVEEALIIAKEKSKWNYIAYLQTMLENGFKPKAKKSAFKHPKKVIRKEMVPNWLNEKPVPVKTEYTADDLQKIERMKQLQEQLLGAPLN